MHCQLDLSLFPQLKILFLEEGTLIVDVPELRIWDLMLFGYKIIGCGIKKLCQYAGHVRLSCPKEKDKVDLSACHRLRDFTGQYEVTGVPQVMKNLGATLITWSLPFELEVLEIKDQVDLSKIILPRTILSLVLNSSSKVNLCMLPPRLSFLSLTLRRELLMYNDSEIEQFIGALSRYLVLYQTGLQKKDWKRSEEWSAV